VVFTVATAAPALLKSLLDILKVNMSIHTIHLHDQFSEHELFRESVIPYLETNRFRPRLLAIQETRPIACRAKVMGRALLSACTDVNSFWMLLSGNAEVAFPSAAATIAAAVNLPTPGTAAATTTVTVSPTIVAAAAAANAATPSADEKRKALP
jgi:hypothetical protein